METPTTPKTKIVAMAMSFRWKAEDSSRQVSEDDPPVVLQGLLEKDADAVSVVEKNESVLNMKKKREKLFRC